MFGVAEDIRPAMRQAQASNQAFVLATLVAVEGGGPRPEGTQMVFAPGVLAGYFSGGCVEGDVAGHAWACLEDGGPYLLKPRLFVNRERWLADAPRDAVLIEPDATSGRFAGEVVCVTTAQGAGDDPRQRALQGLREALLAPAEVNHVSETLRGLAVS